TDLRVMPRTAAEYRLGSLKYEWNLIDEASTHIERAIGLDERTTGRRLLGAWSWRVRADVMRARGDYVGAHFALEQAILGAAGLQHAAGRRRARAAAAHLHILTGNLAAARVWAGEVSADSAAAGSGWYAGKEDDLLVWARLHIAEGAPAEAASLLEEPLAELQASGLVNAAIRFLVVLAVALDESGDHAGALAALKHALDLAEPGRYVRTFVDEGPAILQLLQVLRPRSPYVTELLRAFGEAPTLNTARDAPSDRELEVLRLISQGLDNAAIAEQ